MTYKYVSLGMNFAHSGAGKVSWFHDDCALKMGVVAGGNPEKTTENPPKGTKCYCCGKEVSGGSATVNRTPDGIRRDLKAAGEAESTSPDSREPVQKLMTSSPCKEQKGASCKAENNSQKPKET